MERGLRRKYQLHGSGAIVANHEGGPYNEIDPEAATSAAQATSATEAKKFQQLTQAVTKPLHELRSAQLLVGSAARNDLLLRAVDPISDDARRAIENYQHDFLRHARIAREAALSGSNKSLSSWLLWRRLSEAIVDELMSIAAEELERGMDTEVDALIAREIGGRS